MHSMLIPVDLGAYEAGLQGPWRSTLDFKYGDGALLIRAPEDLKSMRKL